MKHLCKVYIKLEVILMLSTWCASFSETQKCELKAPFEREKMVIYVKREKYFPFWTNIFSKRGKVETLKSFLKSRALQPFLMCLDEIVADYGADMSLSSNPFAAIFIYAHHHWWERENR